MKTPEEIAHLRTELIGHLQAAIAIVTETGDTAINHLIEVAIEKIRCATGPTQS